MEPVLHCLGQYLLLQQVVDMVVLLAALEAPVDLVEVAPIVVVPEDLELLDKVMQDL
jgi:hypothetical protein